jgi:hypothetical protein
MNRVVFFTSLENSGSKSLGQDFVGRGWKDKQFYVGCHAVICISTAHRGAASQLRLNG